MPIKSEAQRRLMYAAASSKGGAGGVSQKVAKEFVKAGPASEHLPEKAPRSLYPKKAKADARREPDQDSS